MQQAIVETLQERRSQIRARWETFLRIEKVNSPLANPDTLVYLFDQTLDEVFHSLQEPVPPKHPAPAAQAGQDNPLCAYFIAGEQALLEALILAQASQRELDPKERDAEVAQLRHIMHKIARRDIGSLEGVFRSRRHAGTNGDNI
ncbi:MAG TPA: hypothetical protein VL200_09260 [Lacunisphaera sp.]|jgi:hypothetical protein|nr:hypothetical protein [Lacunisphaera sp.]